MTAMIPVRLNGRWDLTIPEHRAARPQWHDLDGWEGPRLLAMSERVGPDSTVLYVGAEEGEMPALCASWGARVALFEPNPKVWPNIKAIWDANSLPAPLGWWVGFAGPTTIDRPDEQLPGTGWGTGDEGWPECAYGPVIGDHGFCQLNERPDIPQVTLDDAAARLGCTPTDISLDVEGSEWQVLRGAERILTVDRPRVWLSGHPEFIVQQYGEWLGECRKWLRDKGYRETLLGYEHEVWFLYEPR